jgi:hypothetical protein
MLRLQKLANVNKRRTLRAIYAQSQAYPYAAHLDASVDRTLTNPFDISAEAGKAAIWPGMVAVKTVGETVRPDFDEPVDHAHRRPFGLFANFIGGELDELGDRSEVGIWRGPSSVFEVLAPVFNDTDLASAAADEDGSHFNEVYMTGDGSGRLEYNSQANPRSEWHEATARLISRVSDKAIIIELLV